MQPSSLIFLVIIAIWAAYFVQHWVRRREHLATVRSVDQFTESMRVLERRSPLAAPDLSEPQPRSYSVSPARVSRPQVLVKRAAPSQVGSGEPATADSAATAPGAPGPGTPAPGAPAPGAPATAAPAPAAPAPGAPLPSRRRARGLVFLAALASLPATVALAVLTVVPWPALAAPVAAVAVVLVWMRRGAQAERAARREATRRQRTQRTQRTLRDDRVLGDAAAPDAPDASVRPAHSPVDPRSGDADTGTHDNADAEPCVGREVLYDIQAVERSVAIAPAAAAGRAAGVAAPSVPAVPLVDEDDIPLTWEPVPVPRPTYTMKAMAQRHAPAPVGQGVPPEMAEPAYEESVRRVAGA